MKQTKSIRYINWSKDVIDNANAGWILPQVLASIGNYWPIVRGDHGLYSFTETLRTWKEALARGELDLDGNPISQSDCTALLNWLCTSPRGNLLGTLKQTSGEGIRYSAPVPLLLSSWKQYRDVRYSLWDWSDPAKRFFLDGDILEWSNHFGDQVVWGPEQLTQFRVRALEVKSGTKVGTVRRPESCSSVFGVTDPEFKSLPRLMKLSLCQLWCFHPGVRTDLMITDHIHLDGHPEPLVAGEVLEKDSKGKSKSSPDYDNMWNL